MDTDKKIIELSERLSTDEESKESPFTLKRGQLVMGCVLASGTSEYN